MDVKFLNRLTEGQFLDSMMRICPCYRWAFGVLRRRPFHSTVQLLDAALEQWGGISLSEIEWRALAKHYRESNKRRFTEMEGVPSSQEKNYRESWVHLTEDYSNRFGYDFIPQDKEGEDKHALEDLRRRVGNDVISEQQELKEMVRAHIKDGISSCFP